ncbi:MAG: type VI secretion system protein TssA [Rhodocyclaceae bacterium]|nr:type VI secretion system protein TssA [Rhodocyclaceae bacterium]
MIDLDQLLAEASDSPPCGPDLEYDPAFLELEQASRGKPEQQYGDTLVPAEEPAWPQVRRIGEELLARSKDLRIATLLLQALVSTEGFSGLKPGCDILVGLIERYWDQVHPQLDPDDDNDPIMRMNALAPVADPDELLRQVREAPLIKSRQVGILLVRDVEVALDKLPPKEGAEHFSLGQINDMMHSEDGLAVSALILETLDTLKKLSSLLNEQVGADRAPDLRPLITTVTHLTQVCAGAEAAADGEAEAGEEGEAATGAPGRPAQGPSGDIRNRRDAIMMIDKICDYFAKHEPSNPAPLLLLRAKRLIDMNFMDIVRDMVPEGLVQIETIAGIKNEEDGY